MTRTELERIAILETQIETIDKRTERMDGKLDNILEHFDTRISVLETMHTEEEARAVERSNVIHITKGFLFGTIVLANGLLAVWLAVAKILGI